MIPSCEGPRGAIVVLRNPGSGRPPGRGLAGFRLLTASVEPVETVVHGPIPDQAALHGLLARLETFGVQVVEVRRLHDKDPSADDQDRP